MLQRVLFFLFIFLLPELTSLSLRDKLKEGKVGDFIVVSQTKSMSLIRLHGIQGSDIQIEEITFPQNLEVTTKKNWEEWLKEGAPGHTSWMIIDLDLETKSILECFSFTRGAFLALSDEDSFLIRILGLPLSSVPRERLRRIGPPPRDDSFDNRKIWFPPLNYYGKPETTKEFDIYEVWWQNDGSPLSGKRIELYFDKNKRDFPFPHWAQVTDASEAAFKFRTIDAGRFLPSPTLGIPRRPLFFYKPLLLDKMGLHLFVNVPHYYKEFELYIIDQLFEGPPPFKINFNIKDLKEEEKEFFIPLDLLKNLLQKDHSYSILLTSEKPEVTSVETKEIFSLPEENPLSIK